MSNPLQRRLGRFLDPKAQVEQIGDALHVNRFGGGGQSGNRFGTGYQFGKPDPGGRGHPPTPVPPKVKPVDELPPDPEERYGELVLDRETGRTYISLFDGVSGDYAWEEVTPVPLGVLIQPPTDFSAATAVIVDGVFSAAYRNYRIEINLDAATAATNLELYMRSTAPATITTGYERFLIFGSSAAATLTSFGATNAANWLVSGLINGAVDAGIIVELFDPFSSRKVRGRAHASWLVTATTTYAAWWTGLGSRFTTSCGGFSFQPSAGTITGRVKVFGVAGD